MAYRPERGWGFSHAQSTAIPPPQTAELEDLRHRITRLESTLKTGD